MAVSRERWLLATIGALVAGITWVLFVALTGLGKLEMLAIPLGVIACLVGAWLAISRLRLILWVGAGTIGLLSGIIALTPLTTTVLPTRALVRQDSAPSTGLDAVIVLSGGITADSLLEWEALDRLLTGLALMRDGAAPTLFVTRARRVDAARGSADGDQQALRALVTRPFPLIVVDSVRTTRDEAVNAWRLLQQRGVASPRVGVVTSPLHTRRACATFERVGFIVTCIPATSRAYSVRHADSPAERLGLFRRWLYERAAWARYRSRGWVKG